VSENLLIDAMYSWLDFEYTSVDAFALQGSSIAPLDMITPYTPEDKWNLGVQYQFPWTELGSFTIRADAYYQSDTYADATNSPLNLIEAYTLVNLVTWWDAPDEGWRIEFTVMNLFDEVYYLDLYDQANAFGAVLAQPGLPRTYGIAFQRNF
jgi:iron complex outermembrane receptor protein